MIIKDNARDSNLTEFGKLTLKGQYLLEGENPQDGFARAAQAFCGGDQELAQRIYDYASKLWFSFASPLLANGGTNRGLPISCFLNYVEDSIDGLAENFRENAFLSTNGGGIGTYWGHVRSVGEHTSRGVDTPGVMPFMHVQDAQTLAYHQGKTRRGAAATYMDVGHPEIIEFINMSSTTGGDVHRKNENLHHGVCIPDAFMEAVEADGDWQLIDPHSKNIRATMKARELWIKMLQQRSKLGEPYLFFVDAANRALPKTQKELGLKIHHSNLCTEITLATNAERTGVCCLSSLNIAKFDEWYPFKEQFISDIVTMLDNALDVFCELAPKSMWRAVASVKAERSLGIGTLGFVTYLQQKNVALSSQEAADFNSELYCDINALSRLASIRLAKERGEPSDMIGTGMRHAHLLAIAPNASSSIICGGVSPSIEPMAANCFTQKTKAGSHEVRNPALQTVLRALGKDTEEVWTSIVLNKGSIQHLDFLSYEQKEVFLTATETDAMVMIKLAADRQPFICQAQSVNLFLPADVSTKVLHQTHLAAWKQGLKSLYYLRSSSVKTTSVGVLPELLKEEGVCEIGCTSCEG